MDADSDDDDDDDSGAILSKMEDADTKYDKSKLGPEDAKFSGELADGVNRIRVWPPKLPPHLFPLKPTNTLSLFSSSVHTRPTQTAPRAPASPPAPEWQHHPSSPPSHRQPRGSLVLGGVCPMTLLLLSEAR
jgi:hypothetical protein